MNGVKRLSVWTYYDRNHQDLKSMHNFSHDNSLFIEMKCEIATLALHLYLFMLLFR
jgi:hypothetical protein